MVTESFREASQCSLFLKFSENKISLLFYKKNFCIFLRKATNENEPFLIEYVIVFVEMSIIFTKIGSLLHVVLQE